MPRLKSINVRKKTVTVERTTKRKPTVHVALIARRDGSVARFESNRFGGGTLDGTWASLMGTDRDKVIGEALRLVAKFGADRYEVHVGTLTEKVVIPTVYKTVKL